MSRSSFDGVIPEIPGICVDNFESLNQRAYFLSHCHKDHTQGLTNWRLKRYLEENDVLIYTSEISAAIIGVTPDYSMVKPYVRTLKLGTTVIKLPATKNHQETYVDVTLIPAGHCFGSTMFLFRTPLSTVLFTGDFRISTSDVSKLGHLHDKDGCPITIDKMYVDTTFLGDAYENFPKRTDSVEYIIREVEEWLKRDADNYVALHTSARFGYEYVFNEIYKRLNMKVYVQENDWGLYRSFDNMPGVTNDANSTKVHKCANRSERVAHNCLPYDASGKHFLYIHFSALKWTELNEEDATYTKTSDRRMDVCFPTHCSKNELVYFVNYFSPKRVVGFPNEYVVEASKKEDLVVFKGRKGTGGNIHKK